MLPRRLPDDKLKAISCLEMGTTNKIYLLYDSPWWPEDVEGFAFLHPSSPNFTYSESESERDWTRWILGLYRVQSRDRVMCAWLSGAGARRMERDTDR